MNKNKLNLALKQIQKARKNIEESGLPIDKEFIKIRAEIIKLEMYIDGKIWENVEMQNQN